jgi:hypothetical protein
MSAETKIMSKRPAVESIPLCCNASVKGGEHFIKNKIFSYSMDETWEDVLKDPLCSCEKTV